jgi:3-hydroxyacyl-[acyl-carrier-protein] dehydratase
MRWIWIDRFLEFESGVTAKSVKNVSLAEEHLHDHFPGYPIMPQSLMIEGMAQTGGILVGEAMQFREKVILAKINRAVFHELVLPGDQIIYEARVENLSEAAASISGTATVGEKTVAEFQMMFSHVDRNLAGKKFPEENFVFTEQFMGLLKTFQAQAS